MLCCTAELFCTVLHYTVLYTVQYCTAGLFCTVLHYTVLYTVLYCAVLYCRAVLHCTALYCTLYCTVLLRFATSCYIKLHHDIHYATLRQTIYARLHELVHYTTLHYTLLHYALLSYTTLHLGRDRLKIQIGKMNKVSSYLIDHTVSHIEN